MTDMENFEHGRIFMSSTSLRDFSDRRSQLVPPPGMDEKDARCLGVWKFKKVGRSWKSSSDASGAYGFLVYNETKVDRDHSAPGFYARMVILRDGVFDLVGTTLGPYMGPQTAAQSARETWGHAT